MGRKGRKMIFKTAEEIELIRENCLLVCKTLAYVGSMLKPGLTGEEIDLNSSAFRDRKSVV